MGNDCRGRKTAAPPNISPKPARIRVPSQVKTPAMKSQTPTPKLTITRITSATISQTVCTTHVTIVTMTQIRKQPHLLQQSHHQLLSCSPHCYNSWLIFSLNQYPIYCNTV